MNDETKLLGEAMVLQPDPHQPWCVAPQPRPLFLQSLVARVTPMVAWGVIFATFSATFSATSSVYAQAGLRESLERLDRNENGMLDPDEVTPLSRPYLERITKARRMSLDRANPIDELQEAARVYYALKNGVSGRNVRPEGESTIQPFGPRADEPIVPEFGLSVVKYPYLQEDLDEADSTLRRYDRNEDGYVDRKEASRSRWTHRNPFEMDLDNDNRLSRLELAQRYARRRLLDAAAGELSRKSQRSGRSGVRSSSREDRKEDSSQWWRRGGSDYWLTASLMGRFDKNRNGRLDGPETEMLGIPPVIVDVDRDGDISREELFAHIKSEQEAAGDSVEGLPSWFYEKDADKDGQVAMSEFESEWTPDRLQEFSLYDGNNDGLLTVDEVTSSKLAVGGGYRNDSAEVLPPRKTIVSEIEIDDDLEIGDLNLQLSITHSNTGFLDAYLTSPDGQRIELFTDVGGHGDNFDETIFDDQSREPVTRAKPPFKGSFLPEGVTKNQPGLSAFNGKNAKGVWQLTIRGTRSERFGMLHNWTLLVRPKEDGLVGVPVPTPAQPSAGANYPKYVQPKSDSEREREESERSRREAEEKARYYQKLKEQARQQEGSQGEKRKVSEQDLERFRGWMAQQKASGKPISPAVQEKYRAMEAKFREDRGGRYEEKGDKRDKEDKNNREDKSRYREDKQRRG